MLRRTGTIRNAGVRDGPGSAVHRHSASKTRVNALMAKSYALHRVRDTRRIPSMPQPPSAYDLHQRERWTRHDAHLWIRHDAARFLPPGADPAEVFPELKRQRELKQQREAAEDAAFAAQIAASQRVLTMLRAEVDEMKAASARRRALETKYSPDQPRVPKRNPGGGQFTRIGGGIGQSPSANIAQPMGNVDVGDVSGSSEAGGLFDIAPGDTSIDGVQLAGDIPEGLGKDQGVPSGDTPEDSAGKTQREFAKNRIFESGGKLACTKFGIGRRDLCRRDE